jgi:hypothetical protein
MPQATAPSKKVWVIRAQLCQPDGVGYVGKNFSDEFRDLACYRDLRHALTFDSEAEAWEHLSCFDYAWEHDESGPFYWVEETSPWTLDTQGL